VLLSKKGGYQGMLKYICGKYASRRGPERIHLDFFGGETLVRINPANAEAVPSGDNETGSDCLCDGWSFHRRH
jgi:hypothetical protein